MSETFSREALEAHLIEHRYLNDAHTSVEGITTFTRLQVLRDRRDIVDAELQLMLESFPEEIQAFYTSSRARVLALVGVVSTFSARAELDARDLEYLAATQEMLGRNALVTSELRKLLGQGGDDAIDSSELPVITTEEAIPAVVIEEKQDPTQGQIVIDADGGISVKDKPVKLLPVQRYILDVFLQRRGDPITGSEIHRSDEFRMLVLDQGQTSPPSIAYNNALKGLETRFAKAGIEKLVVVVGGGPQSREVVLNPAVMIEDERTSAAAQNLAEFIFDNVSFNNRTNAFELAKRYFEEETLSFENLGVLESALTELNSVLEGSNISLARDEEFITLVDIVHPEPQEIPPESEPPVPSNPFEEVIMEVLSKEVLKPGVSQKEGVTKKELQYAVRSAGLSIKDFEEEFKLMQTKFSGVIERVILMRRFKGKARPVTRYRLIEN